MAWVQSATQIMLTPESLGVSGGQVTLTRKSLGVTKDAIGHAKLHFGRHQNDNSIQKCYIRQINLISCLVSTTKNGIYGKQTMIWPRESKCFFPQHCGKSQGRC